MNTNEITATATWRKSGRNWFILGKGMTDGGEVIITKKNGEKQIATVCSPLPAGKGQQIATVKNVRNIEESPIPDEKPKTTLEEKTKTAPAAAKKNPIETQQAPSKHSFSLYYGVGTEYPKLKETNGATFKATKTRRATVDSLTETGAIFQDSGTYFDKWALEVTYTEI